MLNLKQLIKPIATTALGLTLLANGLYSCLKKDDLGKYPKKPNVVMILVDSLRQDHLGCYGYSKSISPNMDVLAKESIVCKNAYSAAGWTAPSVASIFTGKYPTNHGVIKQFLVHKKETRGDRLTEEHETLAEKLKENGYRTIALIKNPRVSVESGYSQGFDSFEVSEPEDNEKSAEELTKRAKWHLSRIEKPVFLYIHYMDVHAPYCPPKEFRDKFHFKPISLLEKDPNSAFLFYFGEAIPTKGGLKNWINLYDAAISYTDFNVGDLVSFLKKKNLEKNTILVITADHGEAFYEHGGWGHASLYNEVIKVPLIFKRLDGIVKVVSKNVSSADLMPTLLGYLKIDYDPRAIDGIDIFQATSNNERVIVSQYGNSSVAIYGDYKFMISFNGERKLFNLQTDPYEQKNIYDQNENKHIVKFLETKIGATNNAKKDDFTAVGVVERFIKP